MINHLLFQSDLKELGLIPLTAEAAEQINGDSYKRYIKVLMLTPGYKIQVDLSVYTIKQASLFFVGPNQFLQIKKTGKQGGSFIYYNRDFYCIQIHDKEVACDGLLFNNNLNMPEVNLNITEAPFFSYIVQQMAGELRMKDVSQEEMIRTYLKQLFILATRIWKRRYLNRQLVTHSGDLEFFRKFTLLVEQHYKEKHNVSDYAELLFMAPKTITHKFKRLKLPQPNDIIKNRILLEAKRLLVHTTLTAKEIGYELGYEDPAYFSRLFVQKTGETPSGFRTKFLAG